MNLRELLCCPYRMLVRWTLARLSVWDRYINIQLRITVIVHVARGRVLVVLTLG